MYKIDKVSMQFKAYKTTHTIDFKSDRVCKMIGDEVAGIYTYDVWQSFVNGSYRDNIKFTEEKTGAVLHLGVNFNGFKSDDFKSVYCKVEFNPQKLEYVPDIVRWFLMVNKFKFKAISSVDFAFDIKQPLTDISVITRKDIMTYNTTRYIQPKGSKHGRIKIYDKAKEQGTKEILSRVEITAKQFPCYPLGEVLTDTDIIYLEDMDKRLQEVYIRGAPYRFDSLVEKYGKYDDAIIYALDNLAPVAAQNMLGLMGSTARTKYRAYLKAGSNHNIDFSFVDKWNKINDELNNLIVLNW